MILALALLLQLNPAPAQESDHPTEVVRFNRLAAKQHAAGAAPFQWLPGDMLYPFYLADPRAPYTGSRFQIPFDKKDDIRIENSLGGQVALFRLEWEDDAFEMEMEGAAFGRFNIAEMWDMDGSDYRFGFPMVYRQGRWAFRLSPWHITSHLGDEIMVREKLDPHKYARNELAYGISWDFTDAWRAYGEVGYAFAHSGNNMPGRFQMGMEYVENVFGVGAPQFYAATNWTSFQELDWEGMFTLQAGIWFHSPSSTTRNVRIGVEYFRGHSALTQFFREHEHYWSFGFWFNL